MFYQNKETKKRVVVFKDVDVSYGGVQEMQSFFRLFNVKMKVRHREEPDEKGRFVLFIEIGGKTIVVETGINLVLRSFKKMETITSDELTKKYKQWDWFKPDKGTCKITNDVNSWYIEIEKQKHFFTGSSFADFLGNHFENLGYTIEWDRGKWRKK